MHLLDNSEYGTAPIMVTATATAIAAEVAAPTILHIPAVLNTVGIIRLHHVCRPVYTAQQLNFRTYIHTHIFAVYVCVCVFVRTSGFEFA